MRFNRIISVLGISLLIISGLVSLVSAGTPEHLDCRPEMLKKAELQIQQMIKPLLATVAEQYSGQTEELRRKEQKRARLFRDWLRMRCACQPSSLSQLEIMLCRVSSESTILRNSNALQDREVCLVQN